jgi:hypothetical protein
LANTSSGRNYYVKRDTKRLSTAKKLATAAMRRDLKNQQQAILVKTLSRCSMSIIGMANGDAGNLDCFCDDRRISSGGIQFVLRANLRMTSVPSSVESARILVKTSRTRLSAQTSGLGVEIVHGCRLVPCGKPSFVEKVTMHTSTATSFATLVRNSWV